MPSAAIPAYMIAAVAESPPTTRCRDEPKSANATIGIRIVYSPVITGMPGDLRVAHHLRDRERGERDPGDDVPREPAALVRPNPVENREDSFSQRSAVLGHSGTEPVGPRSGIVPTG